MTNVKDKGFCLAAIVLASIISFPSFIEPGMAGTIYYVDSNNGDDSNRGTSAGQAFRTLAVANEAVQPGDTIVIKSGTYYEQSIKPASSGRRDARITYRAVPGGRVVIKRARDLIDLRDRNFITIEGPISFEQPQKSWAQITNAHHNEISGCIFVGNGRDTDYSGVLLELASFNKVSNNRFVNWGAIEDQWGDAIRLSYEARQNLILGNSIVNAGHSLLGLEGSHNIIRGNYFENKWQKGMDLVWRTKPAWAPDRDFVASFNVVELNVFNNIKLASDGSGKGGMGIQLAGARNVIRRNVFINGERNGIMINGWVEEGEAVTHVFGNRIYNNTFVNNGGDGRDSLSGGIFVTQWGTTDIGIGNNVIKNNIFKGNGGGRAQVKIDLTPADSYRTQYYTENYEIGGNCMDQQGEIDITSLDGKRTLSFYQERYSFVHKNIMDQPRFVDEARGDFHLGNGSACIDGGIAITTTGTGGSGVRIKVKDALYFSDGMGLMPGDQVVVGKNAPVRIERIEYTTNTLMVDGAISWNKGDPVNLPFSGSAPDVGAYESGGNAWPERPAS